MGTAPPEEETGVGVIQRAGHAASIIKEESAEVAYGHRGPIYPLVLLFLAAIAILTIPLVAMLPLVLLAVWIGGHR